MARLAAAALLLLLAFSFSPCVVTGDGPGGPGGPDEAAVGDAASIGDNTEHASDVDSLPEKAGGGGVASSTDGAAVREASSAAAQKAAVKKAVMQHLEDDKEARLAKAEADMRAQIAQAMAEKDAALHEVKADSAAREAWAEKKPGPESDDAHADILRTEAAPAAGDEEAGGGVDGGDGEGDDGELATLENDPLSDQFHSHEFDPEYVLTMDIVGSRVECIYEEIAADAVPTRFRTAYFVSTGGDLRLDATLYVLMPGEVWVCVCVWCVCVGGNMGGVWCTVHGVCFEWKHTPLRFVFQALLGLTSVSPIHDATATTTPTTASRLLYQQPSIQPLFPFVFLHFVTLPIPCFVTCPLPIAPPLTHFSSPHLLLLPSSCPPPALLLFLSSSSPLPLLFLSSSSLLPLLSLFCAFPHLPLLHSLAGTMALTATWSCTRRVVRRRAW